MKELILIIISSCFLFVIWYFVIRAIDKKTRRQQIFLDIIFERSRNILKKEGREKALIFLSRHAKTIIEFDDDVFSGKFIKLEEFIANIGDNYNEKETLELIYREKDIKEFSEFFLSL